MDAPVNAGAYKALKDLPSLPQGWKWQVLQELSSPMGQFPRKVFRRIIATRLRDGYNVTALAPDEIIRFVAKIERGE